MNPPPRYTRRHPWLGALTVLLWGLPIVLHRAPAQSLSASAAAPAPGPGVVNAADLHAAAREAWITARDYPRAVTLFRAALSAGLTGEERERALAGLAEAYWAGGDLPNATSVLTQAVQNGKSPELRAMALWRLAMACMGREQTTGNVADAAQGQAFYAQLVREYPEHPLAPNALLVQANYAVLEEGNRTKAVRLYEELATRYPASEEAKTALGWLPGLRAMNDLQLQAQIREEKRRTLARKVKSKPTTPAAAKPTAPTR